MAGKEKPVIQKPTQWRELLSHSLSTLSVDSSDSNLSSGYLAKRRSQDTHLEEPGMLYNPPPSSTGVVCVLLIDWAKLASNY